MVHSHRLCTPPQPLHTYAQTLHRHAQHVHTDIHNPYIHIHAQPLYTQTCAQHTMASWSASPLPIASSILSHRCVSTALRVSHASTTCNTDCVMSMMVIAILYGIHGIVWYSWYCMVFMVLHVVAVCVIRGGQQWGGHVRYKSCASISHMVPTTLHSTYITHTNTHTKKNTHLLGVDPLQLVNIEYADVCWESYEQRTTKGFEEGAFSCCVFVCC